MMGGRGLRRMRLLHIAYGARGYISVHCREQTPEVCAVPMHSPRGAVLTPVNLQSCVRQLALRLKTASSTS